jgi:formylglycine-generating enzyme required for sulfatase activity
VSRIFLSHASANNAEAVVLYDWLGNQGWQGEVFLDLDPMRGIAGGERWERALNEAANRCEAVLFLISKTWVGSRWCQKEFNLAHRLNKRLFGVLIEDMAVADLPSDLAENWQLIRLASGRDHVMLRAVVPISHEEVHVTFSAEGLQRLRRGLEQAGLDPKHFTWPPADDPNRPPYRGLRPLEAEDAGIFFGRDAPTIEALDKLRGLRGMGGPRLLVILGASGAGKSSFMRAGLVPRLARDDRHFLPLPIIRPHRAVLSGDNGLLRALEIALQAAKIATARADLRAAIDGGATKLRPLLQSLAEKAAPASPDRDDADRSPPTLIISVDQGEELFLAEGQEEARAFLKLLRGLLDQDDLSLIALFTIRSDRYESLQVRQELEGVRQEMLNLPPMPKGSYAEVIKGPASRLADSERPLKLEGSLVDALLLDIDEGGGKDALALLAFTLERLYSEYGGRGQLTLADYQALGGIRGSIEAAVERAFEAADQAPAIPKDRQTRLALLRRGLIPWLAGIDPDSGGPRRRVARKSEIPLNAQPLIDQLVEQRLLATDISKKTGEQTIEPVHEALLRQWGLLQSWLLEDAGLLGVMESVKRASRDWAANGKNPTWLVHATGRLEAAERLRERDDLAANLDSTDREYIATCRNVESAARRRAQRVQILIYATLAGIVVSLVAWINQTYIREKINWYTVMLPYRIANIDHYVLAPGEVTPSFRECAADCPEMILIPAGEFVMGSQRQEIGRYGNEDDGNGRQHRVVIAKPFAVSKFVVTFADWDACVSVGGCSPVSDGGFGRGSRPVININWEQAQQYVAWLSRMTRRPYRLLTEAEWEYAARAGTTTPYYWGEEVGHGYANCSDCGSQWDNRQTSPVGSFNPNAFGLYDMAGNVWQWVEDCFHENYDRAPTDGSAWTSGDCGHRMARGGSWNDSPRYLRTACRFWFAPDDRISYIGFRIARTVTP